MHEISLYIILFLFVKLNIGFHARVTCVIFDFELYMGFFFFRANVKKVLHRPTARFREFYILPKKNFKNNTMTLQISICKFPSCPLKLSVERDNELNVELNSVRIFEEKNLSF